jgi:hypothetical protein
MPGVREVAVIGVPDMKTGEAVRAYVVADEPAPSEAEILAHCRKHLAAYKVPRGVEFRDELPKSLIGKILRKDLRNEISAAVPPRRSASRPSPPPAPGGCNRHVDRSLRCAAVQEAAAEHEVVTRFEQLMLVGLVFVIMFGLGAGLTPRDFISALRRPGG